MYKLLCTTYNKTEQGLVLRNNWIQEVENDNDLIEIIKKWNLPDVIKYPTKSSVSEILEGVFNKNVAIHVRILRF